MFSPFFCFSAFKEAQVNGFMNSFSMGDTHTTTNAFTSFTPSFEGAQGGALTSGGAFADFMSINPCTGAAGTCCQSSAYKTGTCLCSMNRGSVLSISAPVIGLNAYFYQFFIHTRSLFFLATHMFSMNRYCRCRNTRQRNH